MLEGLFFLVIENDLAKVGHACNSLPVVLVGSAQQPTDARYLLDLVYAREERVPVDEFHEDAPRAPNVDFRPVVSAPE